MQLINQHDADAYQETGYLIVRDVFRDDEMSILRQRTEDIANGVVSTLPAKNIELEPAANGVRNIKTVRKLNRCASHDDVFMQFARDERMLNIVAQLIGEDIKLFDSQLFMKPPGGVEKPYHQDSAYFYIEPFELVTCWIALDDVTLKNGCMWVIPGSHKHGVRDHSQEWQVGDRVDMQIPVSATEQETEVRIEMPAGSCSFHHSLIMHRSGPNQTDQHRRGFACHYMSARSRWTDPNNPKPDFPLLRGREFPGAV